MDTRSTPFLLVNPGPEGRPARGRGNAIGELYAGWQLHRIGQVRAILAWNCDADPAAVAAQLDPPCSIPAARAYMEAARRE